ncbi:RagB/SusD family nutrient uptake outer membrane protein [Algoriphagus sp. D3-2-R+10]|uniref:RagB/SusD family nutrient uptake outer membrane protein n=1 Tax=Algoriphagus aurantiacus TaxID=3103948 RepID=UPI002B3686AD|nr:RagB/SusD family nutrient uptake outer membrane protein [Algoriphagus sp. D3-2-R+10]MEB2775664.1 RagB/SusD family nutrient uptake outer membrane protein [Algoriphagus sp. D3-2-R+10]
MKKLINIRYFLIGLGMSYFASSCVNLEEELFSEVSADNFFQTEEEFVSALGQAYSSLGGLGNHSGLWSINEIASDEIVVSHKGGDWFDGGVLLQLHQHEFQPDNPFLQNSWTFLFSGINTCNRLIYSFEILDNPNSPAFIAELRALRALYYYWAMDAFGNVPIVTDFLDEEAPDTKPRSEVYAFILAELNEIIPLLPTAKSEETYGRMTKWAALMIRMKLYLNAEVYTGTAQWALAAADAAEIVDSGTFSLNPSYKENFAVSNGGSNENIFVYPYDKVFARGFNWVMMTLHIASNSTFNLTQQPWNGYQTVEEFYNSYVDPVKNPGVQGPVWKGLALTQSTGTIDGRLSNFLVGPQTRSDGSPLLDPGVEATDPTGKNGDPNGQPITFMPFLNEISPGGLRQAGARIGKYEFEKGGTENMSNDFVIFRLSDAILSLAEAKFRLGQSAEALALVNQVRERAGNLSPFTTLTDENLLAERGREMYVEMTRRQDLIRFKKYGSAWWPYAGMNRPKKVHSPGSFLELFPIPAPQLLANPKLVQNPGYN